MSNCRHAAIAACLVIAVASGASAQSVGATLRRTIPLGAVGREVAFSPDAKLLATSDVEHSIKLWRVSDGALVRTLTHPAGVTSLAVTRDGEWLGAEATTRGCASGACATARSLVR